MKGFICYNNMIRNIANKNPYTINLYLEDAFRNYNDSSIYLVEGKGEGRHVPDLVDEFLERYDFEEIKILKKMTREEIVEYGLRLDGKRLERFLSYFKLTDEEKDLFVNNFDKNSDEMYAIRYYALGQKNAFKERHEKLKG